VLADRTFLPVGETTSTVARLVGLEANIDPDRRTVKLADL